jgi:hypothetical protein
MQNGHSPIPWKLQLGACNTVAGVMSNDGQPVAMLGNALRLNPVDVAIMLEAATLFELVSEAQEDCFAPAIDEHWRERANEVLARIYEFDLPMSN